MKSLQLTLATGAFGIFATMAASQDITLKASHNANADEPYQIGLERMAEVLMEKTDGKATIKAFPNAQLGDGLDNVQGVQLGTIDIAVIANGVLANSVPDMTLFSLPFLFEDAEHMRAALTDPEVLEYVNELAQEQGFRVLGLFTAGTRHIMTTEKPLHSMADLEGLKIRTQQSPAQVDAFREFGANPTPIAYGELYGSLETGVVDGAEAANTNYLSKNFYEVAPNWAQVGWLQLVSPVIMGEQRFRRLPDDVQKALLETVKEALPYQHEAYAESDKKAFGVLKEKDVNITELDPVPFRKAAKAVYEKYIDNERKEKLFDLVQKVAGDDGDTKK